MTGKLRRSATWNVQRGHDPAAQAAGIVAWFLARNLDTLGLQEVDEYAVELRRAARRAGLRFIWSKGQQQGLLVRDPAKVEAWRYLPLHRTYYTVRGGVQRPLQPLAVRYDGAWVVTVHAPVSVEWEAWGNMRGPELRVLAYREHSRRLVTFLGHTARHWPGYPVLILGDHNTEPDTRGEYAPAWVARKGGALVVPPPGNTGHGPIDYALVRGVVPVTEYMHRRAHIFAVSDHHPVTFVTRDAA